MALPSSNVAISTPGTSSIAPKNPIAELKNGKVIFRQKPISFEKASETMQEVVKFREMLNSRVQSQDQPLICIPDEHKPIIVKLAQESDKAAVPLAKQIRSILLGPSGGEDTYRLSLESILPLSVVEHTIKSVMTRINYGLHAPVGEKLPAALCIWRWEVQDAYKDWLPKSARDSADARQAERVQASTDLHVAFESLSQAEQAVVLDPKNVAKLPVKGVDKSETETINAANNESFSMDHVVKESPDPADDEAHSENLPPKGRMKKAPDPEKVAKIKDKEEKRVARAEKEKKQKEAQDRSRSIMVNFFGKVKPSVQNSSTKDSSISTGPSVENDFQRTFRPFVLKKDAELAPFNWLLEGKKKSRNRTTGITHEEAIVIDDESLGGVEDFGVLSQGPEVSTSLGDSPTSLQEFIEELRQNCRSFCLKTRKAAFLKTYNPRSVRDTISLLSDAEIAGDPAQVRHLLGVLRNRQLLPAKVLIFHDDSRPGYYGTWTRNSRIVGPRTPLDRDILAHDYTYDSGEEWEDEGPGDADDVVDGEDDEPDADDTDSDADSWLVDDDEEVRSPLRLDDISPPPIDLSMPPAKRKAENIERRSEKKRKVVVPLVPFMKGPFWESHIGQCQYDPFNVYRIQLLNDAPYPINPFTFVSAVSEEGQAPEVHPSLSGTIQPMATVSMASKRTATLVPKTSFPEAHLSALLAKITDLATPNFTYLVDSIYQEFRVFKIKKNAIEAKVREMTEKSKDKKVWVVKQDVHAMLPRES